MSFLKEFRRRNVHRIAIGYIATSWLLIQVAETILPLYGHFDSTLRLLVLLLVVGFLPALVLSWLFEWTGQGIQREGHSELNPAQRSGKVTDRVIAVILVLGIGYFAIDKFVFDPQRDAERVARATKLALESMQIDLSNEKSIAVLPFVSMSSDPEQEYFAAGVAEELINLLTRVPQLRVVSRSTAFTYKDTELSVPELAKQMNVTSVLQGSVRKAGAQVRISVQLIDASSDSHLWSDSYNRKFEDIFAIQNDISSQVVSQLKIALLGGPPTVEEIDVEAYRLYLEARHIVHTALDTSRTDSAIQKLERVVEIEPNFLPAIHELTRSYLRIIQTESIDAKRFRILLDKVNQGIAKMREIAPDSGYTNGWIAFMAQHFERDYAKSAYYRERSLETATDSMMIINLQQTASLLELLGRDAEALAVLEYVVSRDPACSFCIMGLTTLIRKLDSPQAAAERLEALYTWQGPEKQVKNEQLGMAWLLADEPQKALFYFDQPGRTQVSTAGRLVAMHLLGITDTFESDFHELIEKNRDDPAMIAAVYAGIGRPDEAFQWLEEMVAQIGPGSAGIVKTNIFRTLRSDTRWKKFLSKHRVIDPDLTKVVFNPKLPSAVQDMLSPVG